jgi:cysteine synthase A
VVVEVGARGGGYRIFSDIIREISGVDVVEAVLSLALGERPRVAATRRRAAVLSFFNPGRTGTILGITGVEAARALPNVFDVVMETAVGKRFNGITRDGERPGYVITVADDRAAAVVAADAAEQTVRFEIAADGGA